jgi:hypothetical protein
MSDLALLIPEMILAGMALALAGRIRRKPLAAAGTLLAAMASALAAGWLLSGVTRLALAE